MTNKITLTIDGKEVEAPQDATIQQVLDSLGKPAPIICLHEATTSEGLCRLCVVEVVGWRVLAPACVTKVNPGMVIYTHSERVKRSRRTILEMLNASVDLSEAPALQAQMDQLGADRERFPQAKTRTQAVKDDNPFYIRDTEKCLLCWRCVQACGDDIQFTYSLSVGGRGFESKITTFFDTQLTETTCVFCGNCVAVCPTNALKSKTEFFMEQGLDDDQIRQEKGKAQEKEESVRSTCPYCGVGCQIDLRIKDETIFRVDAPFGVAPNYGRLCSKGRFGIDYVHHPSRLRHPLIRQEMGVKPRQAIGLEGFRQAGWDEALDLAAAKITEIVRQQGGDAIGTFCSAKATNEDNYIFQKFVRGVIGTNNIDHCARLCHAASVAGLQIAIGSPAMSNSIAEMKDLDVFMVTGSNTSETHPVISTFLREAVVKNGARLIVVDPRQIEMTRFATNWLRQKPGTDVVVFQAMAQVIIQENLYDEDFIKERVEGFDNYAASIQNFTPEWAETIAGVPAEEIREAARLYANAERAAIYWGMGISQSVHGTDNALSLANLALLTGNLGKAGTGLNPLRGQNNVQGCSDSGGLPNVFPGYQSVTDPEIRAKFQSDWGVPLNPEAGLTTMEMVDAADKGVIRGFYVMGENPMMSEPDLGHARHVMEKLDFVLVQDIFMNETAAYADIILPATSFAEKEGTFTNSDRRVQLVRQAVPAPGISRPDWEIVADLAQRVEAELEYEKSAGFDFDSPALIWDEMARLTSPFQGITHARIDREDGVHWPCPTPAHPGMPFLFADTFPSGKGRLTPLNYRPSQELPDEAYPLLLSTGRVLYHWHGGTMTRRSKLDDIYPEPTVEVHPQDAKPLKILAGDWIKVRSRRGEIRVKVLITERSRPGMVFIPMHFAEAAANELTLDARDPQAKIPDYKISAVVIERL